MSSAAEKDTVGLCIAFEAIGGMANHALLQVLPLQSPPGAAEVRFQTREHEQLFLVRLLDFVKEIGDSTLTGVKGSCLKVLHAASLSRSFDVDGSVGPLQQAVDEFQSWLTSETPLRLWLPTLDTEARLTVARQDLLFIAANQSKHNVSRLTGVAKHIQTVLHNHGYNVPLEVIPLALDDFRHHLQEDYFVYYGTWIAEFLTRIHWGIQTYLLPTYRRAHKPSPNGGYEYSYTIPATVGHKVAREWFWRLMNHVRSGPYLQPFSAPQHFKKEVLRAGYLP